MAAVAALIATVISVITDTSGILGVAYFVYTVCIIKRVWVFISLVTSSSLTTQLTAGNQKWQKRPRGRKKLIRSVQYTDNTRRRPIYDTTRLDTIYATTAILRVLRSCRQASFILP